MVADGDGCYMSKIENVITYRPVTEQPDLSDFSCGKITIDDHIREALFISKLRTSTILEILVDGYSVGFISYKVEHYPPEPIDWDEEEYQNNYTIHEQFYRAACIEYLAIDERLQQNGIGTEVLRWFLKFAERYLPVRYVLLEATPDNVGWYRKNGFIKVGTTEYDNVVMHVDLRKNTELEKIVEQME